MIGSPRNVGKNKHSFGRGRSAPARSGAFFARSLERVLPVVSLKIRSNKKVATDFKLMGIRLGAERASTRWRPRRRRERDPKGVPCHAVGASGCRHDVAMILFAAGVVYLNYMHDRQAAFDRVLETVRGIRLVLDAEVQGVTSALQVLVAVLSRDASQRKAASWRSE
jgi:hypothetical protein